MERLSNTKNPGFRPVPRTGVIYVMTEARHAGYIQGSSDWANLGQGAPETNPLPDAPERISSVEISPEDHEYAPVGGLMELREAVAELYNKRYRQDKSSKYTYENVAISSGGRVGVTRVVSAMGRTNVGHFLPDYTAYEELLDTFGSFVPIPMLLSRKQNYAFSLAQLDKEILGRGLSSILFSNPCNPTGNLIHGETLAGTVELARKRRCTLILDEFYSHYIYDMEDTSVSAAPYVEDVNKDPVVIVDGLTKNWRYPGFRVSWTVAPKEIIEAVTSAGSFIDGGAARPMQRAAMPLIDREVADQEAKAIKKVFTEKRNFLLSSLEELGIQTTPKPIGGFYCWGNLGQLPEKYNTGMKFFREALKANVITVPGAFFDINPGQRRPDRESRFSPFARFSFGPSMEELERGVKSLKKLLAS